MSAVSVSLTLFRLAVFARYVLDASRPVQMDSNRSNSGVIGSGDATQLASNAGSIMFAKAQIQMHTAHFSEVADAYARRLMDSFQSLAAGPVAVQQSSETVILAIHSQEAAVENTTEQGRNVGSTTCQFKNGKCTLAHSYLDEQHAKLHSDLKWASALNSALSCHTYFEEGTCEAASGCYWVQAQQRCRMHPSADEFIGVASQVLCPDNSCMENCGPVGIAFEMQLKCAERNVVVNGDGEEELKCPEVCQLDSKPTMQGDQCVMKPACVPKPLTGLCGVAPLDEVIGKCMVRDGTEADGATGIKLEDGCMEKQCPEFGSFLGDVISGVCHNSDYDACSKDERCFWKDGDGCTSDLSHYMQLSESCPLKHAMEEWTECASTPLADCATTKCSRYDKRECYEVNNSLLLKTSQECLPPPEDLLLNVGNAQHSKTSEAFTFFETVLSSEDCASIKTEKNCIKSPYELNEEVEVKSASEQGWVKGKVVEKIEFVNVAYTDSSGKMHKVERQTSASLRHLGESP